MRLPLLAFGASDISAPAALLQHEERFAERSCGVHISDDSIKWLTLSSGEPRRRRVEAWGELPLAQGIVEGGVVRDLQALSAALRTVAAHIARGTVVHAALPQESGYVFAMRVPPGTSRTQARALIEFECGSRVPLRPSAAFYSFDAIRGQEKEGQEIGVVVFRREVSESYTAAFAAARIELASLELETRAAARAVVSHDPSESTIFLIDVGSARCHLALIKHGVPVFTATVEMTKEAGIADLSADIGRYFSYWDTRRNARGERVTPIGRIVLVGEGAALEGFSEHIANHTRAAVEHGDIWRHVADFADYIPPIDRGTSFSFAVSAGLALREL
jgi:Tfp pilus assembly PilM family ATPase